MSRLLQLGKEIGLNYKYNKDSWRCVAKEQRGRGQWVENYYEGMPRVGVFLLKHFNKILAKD